MIRFNQDKIERLIHEILKALTHLHELERLSDEEFFLTLTKLEVQSITS